MSINNSITCDACEKELIVDSLRPANYVLELKSVDVGINTSGVTYAVCINPPIKETLHFCGFGCLQDWMNKR